MFTTVNATLSTPVNAVARTFVCMVRTFKARFKEALAEKGYSQAEFARRAGMSRSNVTHWASGRAKKPQAERVDAACAVLDVNVPWLLREEGPKRRGAPPAIAPVQAKPLETTTEVGDVELTKQAILVAKAFMDLPRKRRDHYQRQIETEVLREWASEAPEKPVEEYASARREAAMVAQSAGKKRSSGKHSQ